MDQTPPNNNWVPNKVVSSEWSAFSTPGESLAASCSSPAPGSKQKVVVTWIQVFVSQHTTGTQMNNGCNLKDSGGGTLWSIQIGSAATSQPQSPIIMNQDPLWIGGAGLTLTLAFPSGANGWFENVAMGGYLVTDV